MKGAVYALGFLASVGCGQQDSVSGKYDFKRSQVESSAFADVPVDTFRYYEFTTRLSRPLALFCSVDLRKNKGELRTLGEFTRCVEMDSLYSGYSREHIFYDTNEDGKIDAEYESSDGEGTCARIIEQQEISALELSLKEEYAQKRQER